jgi:hypothetical protein
LEGAQYFNLSIDDGGLVPLLLPSLIMAESLKLVVLIIDINRLSYTNPPLSLIYPSQSLSKISKLIQQLLLSNYYLNITLTNSFHPLSVLLIDSHNTPHWIVENFPNPSSHSSYTFSLHSLFQSIEKYESILTQPRQNNQANNAVLNSFYMLSTRLNVYARLFEGRDELLDIKVIYAGSVLAHPQFLHRAEVAPLIELLADISSKFVFTLHWLLLVPPHEKRVLGASSELSVALLQLEKTFRCVANEYPSQIAATAENIYHSLFQSCAAVKQSIIPLFLHKRTDRALMLQEGCQSDTVFSETNIRCGSSQFHSQPSNFLDRQIFCPCHNHTLVISVGQVCSESETAVASAKRSINIGLLGFPTATQLIPLSTQASKYEIVARMMLPQVEYLKKGNPALLTEIEEVRISQMLPSNATEPNIEQALKEMQLQPVLTFTALMQLCQSNEECLLLKRCSDDGINSLYSLDSSDCSLTELINCDELQLPVKSKSIAVKAADEHSLTKTVQLWLESLPRGSFEVPSNGFDENLIALQNCNEKIIQQSVDTKAIKHLVEPVLNKIEPHKPQLNHKPAATVKRPLVEQRAAETKEQAKHRPFRDAKLKSATAAATDRRESSPLISIPAPSKPGISLRRSNKRQQTPAPEAATRKRVSRSSSSSTSNGSGSAESRLSKIGSSDYITLTDSQTEDSVYTSCSADSSSASAPIQANYKKRLREHPRTIRQIEAEEAKKQAQLQKEQQKQREHRRLKREELKEQRYREREKNFGVQLAKGLSCKECGVFELTSNAANTITAGFCSEGCRDFYENKLTAAEGRNKETSGWHEDYLNYYSGMNNYPHYAADQTKSSEEIVAIESKKWPSVELFKSPVAGTGIKARLPIKAGEYLLPIYGRFLLSNYFTLRSKNKYLLRQYDRLFDTDTLGVEDYEYLLDMDRRGLVGYINSSTYPPGRYTANCKFVLHPHADVTRAKALGVINSGFEMCQALRDIKPEEELLVAYCFYRYFEDSDYSEAVYQQHKRLTIPYEQLSLNQVMYKDPEKLGILEWPSENKPQEIAAPLPNAETIAIAATQMGIDDKPFYSSAEDCSEVKENDKINEGKETLTTSNLDASVKINLEQDKVSAEHPIDLGVLENKAVSNIPAAPTTFRRRRFECATPSPPPVRPALLKASSPIAVTPVPLHVSIAEDNDSLEVELSSAGEYSKFSEASEGEREMNELAEQPDEEMERILSQHDEDSLTN